MRRRAVDMSCHYCDRRLRPTTENSDTALTFDHVVPKTSGGNRTVPCCRACNRLKGNLMPHLWWRFIKANPKWWKTFRTNGEVVRALRGVDQ